MLLARITIEIKSPDEMSDAQVDNVIDDVENVDWEALAYDGLRQSGVGETILGKLVFNSDV